MSLVIKGYNMDGFGDDFLNIFEIFFIFFLFVAICDLVHNVDTIHGLY